MDIKLTKNVESPFMKTVLPNIEVGDTVNVTTVIRDDKGEKKRTQDFRGLVIAMKNSGVRKTVTVRKVSGGVGVEKIFPIHSPNVEAVEIIKKGDVRQSKIYYMRDRIGKLAMKVNDSSKEIKEMQIVDDEYMPQDAPAEPVAEESTEADSSTLRGDSAEPSSEQDEVKAEEPEVESAEEPTADSDQNEKKEEK